MPDKGSDASQLVEDLSNIPSIIGALGLSIAEAQKAFNLDYMNNIERLFAIAKSLDQNFSAPAGGGAAGDTGAEGAAAAGEGAAAAAPIQSELQGFVRELLKQLAPPRYQFTETTLAVKLDLAQTMNRAASGGFSVGYGAFAVNAAMSVAYGTDYRAAAEVRTVLHAVSADATTFGTLLGRAKELSADVLELPDGADIDSKMVDQVHKLVNKLSTRKIENKTKKPT